MVNLADILTSLQQGVVALGQLNNTMLKVFPQTTATSTIASTAAGVVTYTSSQARIFISVTTSSGGVYKIPGY